MSLMSVMPVFDFAKGVMDRFFPKKATDAEKMAAMAGLVPMLQERENAMINAQKEVMVAELNQGDKFTKRARPSIIYLGLLFIGLVHVIFPMAMNLWLMFGSLAPAQILQFKALTAISLPGAFWAAWGSVCSVYALGRSAEKRGAVNKVVSMITGNK